MTAVRYLDGKPVELTPQELAAIEADKALLREDLDKTRLRQNILARLTEIDLATIRPLRSGDTARVAELEAEAAVLRQQLQEI